MNFNNQGLVLPDVSFWQDDNSTSRKIDFVAMKSAGAVGVIIRAGQNNWIDQDFKDYWRAAKQAGLPRGAYWFYDSRSDPVLQAVLWKQAIDGDYPELKLWIDLEENYGGQYKGEKYWKIFAGAVRAEFPSASIGVYTAEWYWNQQAVMDPEYWSKYPLWVAEYGTVPTLVTLPYPWRSRNKDAVLWQYTAKGDGTKYGVESGNIDLNYFNGTPDQFKSYFQITDALPLPDGDPMPTYRYEANNLYADMSLRAFHNTAGELVQKYPADTTWHGDYVWVAPDDLWIDGTQVNKAGDKWLEVKSINGGAKAGWVALTHRGTLYCTLVEINPPAEEPGEITPPRRVTVEDKDGVIWEATIFQKVG